ncbi:MAG: hypothetical protein DRP87_00290 [Spirochaetes bacterium]|nr:MAG: hypothetical protein DRP87_00290 [Spirochaetota bacterium]
MGGESESITAEVEGNSVVGVDFKNIPREPMRYEKATLFKPARVYSGGREYKINTIRNRRAFFIDLSRERDLPEEIYLIVEGSKRLLEKEESLETVSSIGGGTILLGLTLFYIGVIVDSPGVSLAGVIGGLIGAIIGLIGEIPASEISNRLERNIERIVDLWSSEYGY